MNGFLREHARFEKFHVAVGIPRNDAVFRRRRFVVLSLPVTEKFQRLSRKHLTGGLKKKSEESNYYRLVRDPEQTYPIVFGPGIDHLVRRFEHLHRSRLLQPNFPRV